MANNRVSATSTKLRDLALADLGKDEKAKKTEAILEAIDDNKVLFENELHKAKKVVKACEKTLTAYQKSVTSTPQQIMDATDELALAKRTVECYSAIIAKRF